MKIIIANLSAQYAGRGQTKLAPYVRTVVIKNDNSVAIHSEKGFKPLNYMTPPLEIKEEVKDNGEVVLTFDSRTESLTIILHQIIHEFSYDLGGDDPGLEKDHTESDLQAWVAENIEALDPSLRFLEREYETGSGPVDILAENQEGELVALEIKRVAPMATVGQVLRYTDAIEEQHPDRRVSGAIAALDIKEKTRTLAKKKEIKLIEIPPGWKPEPSSIVEDPAAQED